MSTCRQLLTPDSLYESLNLVYQLFFPPTVMQVTDKKMLCNVRLDRGFQLENIHRL